MSKAVRVALCAVVVALNAGHSLQGQQAPTFRAGTQLIEIDVRVTDRDGRFIGGLSRDDFEVLEDGKPQRITQFSFVNLPARGEKVEPLAARDSARSNGAGAAQGRTYVMLLDGPGTGRNDHVERMHGVARLFLDQAFGPTDRMAVTFVREKFQRQEQMVEQPFTTDRRAIEVAVDRLAPETRNRAPVGNPGNPHVRTYEAIEDISNRLGATGGGRKALVWIGGAVPFDPMEGGPGGAEIAFAYRDAIRAANRHNVAIYPVDLLGLTNRFTQPQGGALDGRGPGAELKRMAALRVVADDTGGEPVVGTNNYAEMFAQIASHTSTYYLLGYQAADRHCDGRFHPIAVRVNRAGASVRARRGYFSPEPGKSAAGSANQDNSTPSGVCE
jgi:Ca-activated chloride channel family protein